MAICIPNIILTRKEQYRSNDRWRYDTGRAGINRASFFT